MWRPDPGPCVPEPSKEPDLDWEKQIKSLPKKILKRREITCKTKDLRKAVEKNEKVNFSVVAWHLTEFSKSSGYGDEAGSVVHVFYEAKDERKVLNVFSSSGIDLEAAEAVPVDPKSPYQHEQECMYHKEPLFLEDPYMYEEGPPDLTIGQ
eukprot:gnl/TRDRNA2_/TRDRNA2_84683_c0_seq1.p1 gnl/TRDRNA2_/TRDRNA2_84683_c0~~gnl/TRDRNA2_/TRDRNA2_84683_c0_seq1.p1  ORF type:complete len:151 (+),score=50.95 gnl/TRDRNA2_/TRDRNA2_84683_c0_seq1:75-527(+)